MAGAHPGGRFLELLVGDQPDDQLLAGLLRRQLLEVELLGPRQQLRRLDLQQRAHQDEEFAGGVEVEFLLGLQPLQIGDDDVGERHLEDADLFLEDERQQQVERTLEDFQVEVEEFEIPVV